MPTGSRLVVTADDVTEAEAALAAAPPVLTIQPEDVGAASRERLAGRSLQVTLQDVADFEPAGSAEVAVLEQLMARLVNDARESQLPRWLGKGPLRWHPGLAAVARAHSADMLNRRYVDHVTPEGLTVGQRLDRAGISYLACGENIGVVYGPASHGERGIQEVQQAFMNQPRRLTNHRGNILNPVWTHVGIGVAYTPEGQLVATQNFLATLGSAGPRTGA